MVRELIYFELNFGAATEEFDAAFRAVHEAMAELGVVVGRVWGPMTGEGRTVILEREFESLAAYEDDDRRFHDATDFMRLWRTMETTLRGMRVDAWQG
jgi:hypothetical protein